MSFMGELALFLFRSRSIIALWTALFLDFWVSALCLLVKSIDVWYSILSSLANQHLFNCLSSFCSSLFLFLFFIGIDSCFIVAAFGVSLSHHPFPLSSRAKSCLMVSWLGAENVRWSVGLNISSQVFLEGGVAQLFAKSDP
jgi:hypothetical protein